MNGKCSICEAPADGQCCDCHGFYCSEHGAPRYCVFCALRHNEPEPLRHALGFDIWIGYKKTRAQADSLAYELKLGREGWIWVGAITEKKAELQRLEAEATRREPFAEKAIRRLLDLLHDPDYTTRYRVAYILRGETDERIVNALTEVIEHDKNQWVREAAFKAFWYSESARSNMVLSRETLHKAWREKKLRHEVKLRELLVGRWWGGSGDEEFEREERKYIALDIAIDVVRSGEEHTLDMRPLMLLDLDHRDEDEQMEWAKQILASASREDLQVCLRRGFNDWRRLRWTTVKGSVFEQDWIRAGLPTSEEEENEAWERPRTPPHGAEDTSDPIWYMANYV